MKVLLLNPPFLPHYSRQSRSPCATESTIYYPYFLAYAAGVLEKEGFEVKLVDAVMNEWSRKETFDFVESYGPKLIVIDTSTPSIFNDLEIARKIKELLPESHISLVGTHPTAMPDWALRKGGDSVCRGEYDYTVKDLAHALAKGKKLESVKGLSFKSRGKVIHNPARPLIQNLDDLPFVSAVYKKHFGEEGIKKYFYASLRWPEVTILTARGCPYGCSFCNSPFKKSYRPRSIENVAAEFKYIEKELPFVKEIMIEDETFPADEKRTVALCDLLIKEKTKLRWSCNARVNTSLETLKKMRGAGCRLMCVGFESPGQNPLDSVHKGTTGKMQMEFMNNTRKAGLLVHGCFILGMPGDTIKTIRETVEFAKKLNPDTAQFYPLMVYPGTEAYAWAKEKGYLTTEDFNKWLTKLGCYNVTVVRPGLSNKELMAWCDLAKKEFYLRAPYMVQKMCQVILTPEEATRIFKSAKAFFGYSLNATRH
jgi:radical SAM superfamily enzyme YgiQ (UPF0313 family)